MDRAQAQLDTRAIEIAVRAQSDVANHEKVCAERYQRILEHQQASAADQAALRREISAKFKDLYGFMWRVALSIIATLFGGFSFLLWQFIGRSAP